MPSKRVRSASNSDDDMLNASLIGNDAIEKFAELLINDLIDLISKQPIRVEYIGGQSFKYIQLGETLETIKEHFGVEE